MEHAIGEAGVGLSDPVDHGPEGFDVFWQETLDAHVGRGHARFETVDSPLRGTVVEDVTFPGFGGCPVRGWMLTPAKEESRGTVVQFLGNNTGRGLPEQWTLFPSAGYTTFVMDNRGQTGPASVGDTPDPVGNGPQIVGRMTSGIQDPDDYYYRRLFTDAVCAIGAVREHVQTDENRIFVAGGSQGGATALAATALCEGLAGAIIDVPLLCDIRHAVDSASTGPFTEILNYLRTQRGDEDTVFQTLSYFDGLHFASRAHAPALFAVGMRDPVCPPGSVLAAFEAYAGTEKTLCTYPFDGHEHGQWQQKKRHLEFLALHTEQG